MTETAFHMPLKQSLQGYVVCRKAFKQLSKNFAKGILIVEPRERLYAAER